MIRLHLDEQVHGGIARALRNHGIDVTTAIDAGLLEARDEEHIAFALGENRVIITHDRHFLVLHAAGVEHAGIIYCHQQKYGVGELLQMLLLANACFDLDELRGRVEFL